MGSALEHLLDRIRVGGRTSVGRHDVSRIGSHIFLVDGRPHSRAGAAVALAGVARIRRHGDAPPAVTLSRDAMAFLSKASKGIKGTGLTIEALYEVAPLLGWSIVEQPVATRLSAEAFWNKLGGWNYREVIEYSGELWFKTREEAASLLAAIRANPNVSTISGEPIAPVPGLLYVEGLSGAPAFAARPSGAGHQWTVGLRKAWLGELGWTLRTPTGSLHFALLQRSKSKVELPQPRLWSFFYKSGVKEAAQEALASIGVDTVERTLRPSAVRELENTGTCPCCFKNVKLRGDRIVEHGWREASTRTWSAGGRKRGVSGEAWHTGSCFGVGYPPFELSKEGTQAYLDRLLVARDATKPDEGAKRREMDATVNALRHALATWRPKPLPR